MRRTVNSAERDPHRRSPTAALTINGWVVDCWDVGDKDYASVYCPDCGQDTDYWCANMLTLHETLHRTSCSNCGWEDCGREEK